MVYEFRTDEKNAVQTGTELLQHGTSHTVSGLLAMPAQRRTFLDCKVGTRPKQCGFQDRQESCTLGNFVVNLGNFLYLLLTRRSSELFPSNTCTMSFEESQTEVFV